MSALSAPHFHDDVAAFAEVEHLLWPEGPVCPHCGSLSGKHYGLRKTRVGLRKCSDCRKQFTVKVGTVFECAKIPLHLMLQAAYLLCVSKQGCNSYQIHRTLGITYKSAWFLTHRIREALRSGDLAPMGGEGTVVEVGKIFIGPKGGATKRRGYARKRVILSLVERGSMARSFHVDSTATAQFVPILRANIAQSPFDYFDSVSSV